MRIQLLAILLLAASAAPAIAQDNRLDRRVGKLEQEMQAVQRRVFPNGPLVQPEIRPDGSPAASIGSPASTAVADLTARVDALEAQLARLTGQSEQNAFRLRQLDETLNSFKADAGARLEAIEAAAAPAPQPERRPEEPERLPEMDVDEPAADAAISVPSSGDPADDAYLAGFRLWDAGRHADARRVLEPIAKQYPDHRRASWAGNLAGRAALDGGDAAGAAKLLLANYQANPKGERAADSLFFLGEALVALERPADACKVYEELEDVYGNSMRDFIRQRLPKARADANCS